MLIGSHTDKYGSFFFSTSYLEFQLRRVTSVYANSRNLPDFDSHFVRDQVI